MKEYKQWLLCCALVCVGMGRSFSQIPQNIDSRPAEPSVDIWESPEYLIAVVMLLAVLLAMYFYLRNVKNRRNK